MNKVYKFNVEADQGYARDQVRPITAGEIKEALAELNDDDVVYFYDTTYGMAKWCNPAYQIVEEMQTYEITYTKDDEIFDEEVYAEDENEACDVFWENHPEKGVEILDTRRM